MKKTGILLLIRRSTEFVRSDLSDLSEQSVQFNPSEQSKLSSQSDQSVLFELVVLFLARRLVFFHALGFGAFSLEFFFPVQNFGKFLAAA